MLPLPLALEILIWALLLAAAFIDFKKFILPNVLILPAIALTILHAFFVHLPVLNTIISFVLPPLAFLLIGLLVNMFAKKETFGFGDVKLLVVLGGLLGWQKSFYSILLASITALLTLLLLTALKKRTLQDPVAFGFYLVLAGGIIRIC